MNKRTLSYYLKNGRWWFAFLFFTISGFLILNAAPITVNANSSTYFIANEGQWEGDFQFKCEVGSAVYYVTPKGMTVDFREFRKYPKPLDQRDPMAMFERDRERDSLTVRGHVVQIHYVEGNVRSACIGEGKLSHYSNYFLGRDSTKWRSRVGHYENVIVPEVWQGIDVEYRTDKQGVETIYHVKPGADPSQIQMEYLGLDAPLQVDSQGNLILSTSLGDVKENAPFAFQQERRMQKQVDAGFRVMDESRVGYELGVFDVGKELVVDPLIYSTFFANGSVDAVTDIEIDNEGNKVVSGNTNSSEFPVTPGAYWEVAPGEFFNGYITRLTRNMDSLVFSTYFASNSNTDILIAIDQTIWWLSYVFGETEFPLTANALNTVREISEVGIAHLSADGTQLLFGSYWGGNRQDQYADLCEDGNGNIYIPGTTQSTDLYTTPNALSDSLPAGLNAYLLVIDPTDHSVLYSTYFPTLLDDADTYGGNITLLEPGRFWWNGVTYSGGIPVTPDAFQPVFEDTTGWPRNTSFFCLLDIFQEEFIYCSYWGTAEGEWGDNINTLIPLQGERLLICGTTTLPDYSFPPGGYQEVHLPENGYGGFIVDFALSGQILAGTFLGGHESTYIYKPKLLSDSTIVVTGRTRATDFPSTPDAEDSTFGGGDFEGTDVVVARLSSDLSTLLYGSYLGGNQIDIVNATALHTDNYWLVGSTQSSDFPRTPDAMYPEANAIEIGFITGFEFVPNSVSPQHLPSTTIPGNSHLEVFPNPFNSVIQIVFLNTIRSKTDLVVYDILGRNILSQSLGILPVGSTNLSIHVPDWASGSYFIQLRNLSGTAHARAMHIK